MPPEIALRADQLSIRELIDRISDLINHRDWNALLDCFAEDIVWEQLPPDSSSVQGRAAIGEFLTGNEESLEVLFYSADSIAVDVQNGERAKARATVSELIRFKETGRVFFVVGSNHDEFVQQGGRWLLSRRTVSHRYSEERRPAGPAFE